MASELTDNGRTQGPGDHFSALIPAWEVEKKGCVHIRNHRRQAFFAFCL